jgi:hypothetical protein
MSDDNQEQMGCITVYILMTLVWCLTLPIALLITNLFTFGFGLREWIGSKHSEPPSGDDIFGMLFLALIGFGGSLAILLHRGWSLRRYLRAFAIGIVIIFLYIVILLPIWRFATEPVIDRLADRWLSRERADLITNVSLYAGICLVAIWIMRSRGWLHK